MYSEQFYPQVVDIEITNACNMRCLHCGSRSGKCRQNEMSTADLKNLVNELVGLGAESIALTGGEPLMRRDWSELVSHIRSCGVLCCLLTNGYLITPDVLKTAVEVDLNGFSISLDGLEDTHDHIRQTTGAWRRATNAMRLIKEQSSIRFAVETTLSGINLHELEQVHNLVSTTGCHQWRVQLANSVGRMSEQADKLLSDAEFESLVDRIILLRISSPVNISVGSNIGFYGNKGAAVRGDMPWTGDYSGLRGVGITANGDVKGDLSMPGQFVEGNIRESSFTEIWTSNSTFSYNRQFNMDMVAGFCRECRYLKLCRGGDSRGSFALHGIRANSPYCMYRIEHARGEEPVDSPLIKSLLRQFGEAQHQE